MSPPFLWAQSLNSLEFEIKYAYRHDVAGCADLFNETVEITKDNFKVGASCKELDRTMRYELNFKLWDEIDKDTVKLEKRPVGKHFITMKKLTQPARWKQLWLEDTPKPDKMKLWFDKHTRFYSALYEFEGDEVDEFPGHNIFDDDDEDDEEEGSGMNDWLHPPKGPGKFAKKNKKKKSKKSANKKKKKSKKDEL